MKSSIFFSAILFVIISIFMFSKIFYIDDKNFQDVDFFSKKIKSPKNFKTSFKCSKEGVEKDVFFLENGVRHHCKIRSKHSDLSIENKKAFEKMEGIEGFLQDELVYENNHPKQEIKYFKAPDGIYLLSNHQFLSEKVDLAFFKIDGHTLPHNIDLKSAYLTGSAKNIDISFIQNSKSFNASYLKTKFLTDQLKEAHVRSKKPH